MLVQIYAIKSIEEARMCIDAGADRFGIVVGENGRTPDETGFTQTRRIFEAAPERYPKMALTVETELDAIVRMVLATRAEILHLSGDILDLDPDGVAVLRERLPGVQIVQAIPVTGQDALGLALAYESVSDVIFLDTKDPGVDVVGATGAVHDWSISREIVQKMRVPVILAGGLSPENVAEAIRVVRPWGVDSNTHTNIPGTWEKDAGRIQDFVQVAKGAVKPAQ